MKGYEIWIIDSPVLLLCESEKDIRKPWWMKKEVAPFDSAGASAFCSQPVLHFRLLRLVQVIRLLSESVTTGTILFFMEAFSFLLPFMFLKLVSVSFFFSLENKR